jgi:hypothetical protein
MALKRGGGLAAQSLDGQVPEAEDDAAQTFDRAWAVEVIARAQDRLAGEEHARGAGAVFDALRPYLDFNAEAEAYATVGARLGLGEGAVKVAVHRLRQRLGTALRAELAETLADPTPEAIATELAALQAALGGR